MTLSVPEELYRKMQKHSELKWSDIARQSFKRKIEELELFNRLLRNSKLTEEEAEEIGHKIKHAMRKRLESKGF
ncbi:MAG TPA: hypothetical protein VJI67_01400 [archaeon]|nr:hypothetical protein [archaeon]HLD81268.1 hypothetical protein [archaeon]